MAQQQYVAVPYNQTLLKVYNDPSSATPGERIGVATLFKVYTNPDSATPGEKNDVAELVSRVEQIRDRPWNDAYRDELIERNAEPRKEESSSSTE